MTDGRVLALFLEPAPYVMSVTRELRRIWGADLDVLFVDVAMTQAWRHDPGGPTAEALPRGRLAAIAQIWRRLSSRRYRIVHLDGWGHPLTRATILIAACLSIPVTIDTDTPPSARAGGLRRLLKRLIYPLVFRAPALFFPFGSRQAAYLRGYGVDDARICVSQMAGDTQKIASECARQDDNARLAFMAEHGVPTTGVRFLYVGRLEDYKGVLDLLAAFRALRSERSDVHLLVVGDGAARTEVLDLAVATGAVSYFGQLGPDTLWRPFDIADALILPSHRENWGMVVGEAMAAGLPVIVSDEVGCIDDLVRPNVSGLVFKARSREALTGAMRAMADDNKARTSMSAEARRLVSNWTAANSAARIATGWRGITA